MTGRAYLGRSGSGMVKKRLITAVAVGLAGAGAALTASLAHAETLSDKISRRTQQASDKKDRLLVESRELVYDKDKNVVSAVGNAQLYYQGRVLEADKVIYDRNTNRVFAEGNAKMTEANGQVLYGQRFEITGDFKDGFIDSLRIDTIDKTHFVAPRGERIAGDATIFDKGTYTACDACKDDPSKPPLWQVRAKRIIHRNEEHTIYYEDASLEFYGIPIAWIPYFSAPDSTVKRKTGFLAPRYVTSSTLGVGASLPFFWDIAPNYDLTLTPTILSRQGFLGSFEWRHRLVNGSYQIRGSGIFQQDPGVFLPSPYGPGNLDFRGSIESQGKFLINEKWQYGWDVSAMTDKWFQQNYKFRTASTAALTNLASIGFRESISTAYLTGQGDRSYFDARGYYFYALSYTDWQKIQPVVLPVIDYDRRFTPNVIGGELQFNANITSLSREQTDFNSLVTESGFPGKYFFPIASSAGIARLFQTCAPGEFNPYKCLVRGVAGNYTRASAELAWRRTFIDSFGESWTPFVSLRGDLAFTSLDTKGFYNQYLPNFIDTNNEVIPRGMPAAGVTYRYPFVASTDWGTHTIEPIAQIIARGPETQVGKMPNEDAQSLVYDDTNLFDVNKFSGYDRVEGGGRANVGAQYTFTSNGGAYANALFGQSYQLFGPNSYAQPDLARTGYDSGLQTTRSAYVSRIQFSPDGNFNLLARGRFDETTWAPQRMEVQASATFGKLTGSVIYARYAAQPDIGQYTRREGISTSARFNINQNWNVSGGVQFDFRHSAERYLSAVLPYQSNNGIIVPSVTTFSVGAGYKDECTTFGITYLDGGKMTLADGSKERVRTVLLRLELRTLGSASYSYRQYSLSQDGITQ